MLDRQVSNRFEIMIESRPQSNPMLDAASNRWARKYPVCVLLAQVFKQDRNIANLWCEAASDLISNLIHQAIVAFKLRPRELGA